MKKSTLITTIAMIVVVVVALSTATYAWFTSSSNTYATSTIAIEGTSGIEIAVNETILTGANTAANAAFTGTNFLQYAEAAETAGIKSDIWAPHLTDIISSRPSANSATACTKGTAVNFTKGLLNSTKTTLTIDKIPTEMSPDIIRVTNADSSAPSKEIKVTIYIAAKNDIASYYTAQGVCAYIAGVSNVVESVEQGKIAYTDYYYVNKTKHATLTTESTLTAADVGTTNTAEGNSFIAVTGAGFTESTSGVNHDDIDSYTPGTKMTLVSAAAGDDATDLAALSMTASPYTSGKYYSLTYSLGTFNMNESKNFVIYTWLDGVYLNNSAKGAQIKIAYKFSYVIE